MKAFLRHVAEDIIGKYGTDLSDVVVVFPNKRASLFLNEHLLAVAGKPVWRPRYTTISELFRSKSPLTVTDTMQSVAMLYEVYSRCLKTGEPIDRFWSWGEVMLSDFDDLDKNLADAEQVFGNVSDLRRLDGIDYLDEEKRETLKRFFAEFSDSHGSLLKQRFEQLWNQLARIYAEFNASMKAQSLAYEGALYREVAESAEQLEWHHSAYLFVGFNAVQKAEQTIFKSLKDKGLAHFYWDFDDYYVSDGKQEAGAFISQWLAKFPNELDIKDEGVCRNFATPKDVTFLSAATENIQARFVDKWLKEQGRMESGIKTAIVLCDESLLKSVIHYLPPEASGRANITIGYPLSQTPAAAFAKDFLALHLHAYNAQQQVFMLKQTLALLRHPFASMLSAEALPKVSQLQESRIFFPKKEDLCDDEGLSMLFTPADGNRSEVNATLLSRLVEMLQRIGEERAEATGYEAEGKPLSYEEQFLQESIYKTHNVANRLHGLITSGGLTVEPNTLLRLLDQIIRQTTMPFHGEPAVGLQVMGVLETRNLDFDHLLILSCNEGNMPKGVTGSSLIPYSIRKAYGLTTPDNKAAIYAYYFYRLLQRCKDISIAWNCSTEDGHTGQMSRFMPQLMVEKPSQMRLHFKSLTARQLPLSPGTREIRKDTKIAQALNRIDLLSPSRINDYLRCPMLFYYKSIVGLREPDADSIDDSRMFGTIFHKAAQRMYESIMTPQGEVTRKAIEMLLRDGRRLRRFVDDAFREDFFNGHAHHYDGLQLINFEVACRYIRRLLEADCELAPFHIVGLEVAAYEEMTVSGGGKPRRLFVGGIIDRLDRIDADGQQRLRVIDYKTGGKKPTGMGGIDDIFNPENIGNHSDYYLQSMLYSMIVRHMDEPRNAPPSSRRHQEEAAGECSSRTIPALNPHGLPVSPALLFIRHPDSVSSPVLKIGLKNDAKPIDDIGTYESDFRGRLEKLIGEILDPDGTFVPRNDENCERCAFASLCRRS